MLNPGTSLGPYRILAPIGAGGMGEVYRAHDPRLGRDVAIKVLAPHLTASPEARARFEREARTISQLSHPHICTLHDVGHQEGTDYLVMELLEGETLAHRLEKGPLPVAEALTLGSQIAEALDVAHRHGIVHRDLKPGNVMLTKGGVKLMDFGLARAQAPAPVAGTAVESPTLSSPLTMQGAIVGTFQYMAPEQLEGKESDARSDIWAIGCVLYEMATGKRAFEGQSQASLISAIMKDEPRPITELQPLSPPALERAVKRCLMKNPDDRWQSARDVAHALDLTRTASGAPTIVGSASRGPRSRDALARTLAAFLGGALLVAILAFVAERYRRPWTDPEHVNYTRLTFQRGEVGRARFSPDSKTVVYSASWDGGPAQLYENRIGYPVSRPLGLTDASLQAISGDGMMAVTLGQPAYYAGGTLAEIPLSGGVPRQLLEDVVAADWAPDGKTLAVARSVEGRTKLEMPPGHVLYETAGMLFLMRLSRDGRHIALVDNPVPQDSRGTIVIVDRSGRVAARTAEWGDVTGLAWSADGREAWYTASQNSSNGELRAVSLRGRDRAVERMAGRMAIQDISRDGRVLLVRQESQIGIRGRGGEGEPERELGWLNWPGIGDLSADGRTLLFDEEGCFGGPNYVVCLRGMDGSPPVKLGEGRAAALSPDGRWALAILYGPQQRMVLYPTGPGDSTSIAPGPIENYYVVRWMPDGKRLIFAASERGHGRRTYVQDLAGGPPRAITPEGIAGVTLSPDGRIVAAVSADQQLYVCGTSGGPPRAIAPLLPLEIPVQWSPDARSVFVASNRAPRSMQVYRVDIATGRRTPWRRFGMADSAGVTLSDLTMTPDGASYAIHYSRHQNDLYLVDGLK